MDRILAYIVRIVVWLSGFMKPLSRLGLCRYETYKKGQPLPDNLYVCDASLLPQSLGLPPILTIMAMAKRIAKIIAES